jgi:hypothetical protein
MLEQIKETQSSYNLKVFFICPENSVLFAILAPLLRRLPCSERVRVQTPEFKANIE